MFESSMPDPIEEIMESITGEGAGPFNSRAFLDEQGPLDPEQSPLENRPHHRAAADADAEADAGRDD